MSKTPSKLQNKKQAIKKRHQNVNWKLQCQKLVTQFERRGYEVIFKNLQGYSEVDLANMVVSIHSRHNHENTFYTLVHEFGHILLLENPSRYSQNTGYVYNNFTEKSMTWKVNELSEEYEAWQVGYKFAKKMKMKINRINFEKYKAKCIITYVEWLGEHRNKQQ